MPSPDNAENLSEIIMGKHPNGFDFTPSVLRLVGNEIGFPVDDDLLLCFRKKLWSFPESFITSEISAPIVDYATSALEEYGGFSELASALVYNSKK